MGQSNRFFSPLTVEADSSNQVVVQGFHVVNWSYWNFCEFPVLVGIPLSQRIEPYGRFLEFLKDFVSVAVRWHNFIAFATDLFPV